MSEAPEPLLEAALRPIAAQPEPRQAGLRMLEGLWQASHPGAAAMLARWAVVDARTRRSLMFRVLALAVVLVSAWVLVGAVQEGMRYWGIYKSMKGGLTIDDGLVRGLGKRDRFLLLGDTSRPSQAEQIRALCVDAPEDAGCFAAYAMKYREAHNAYPPDFLQTARRLDPGNAWFTYLAAADLARNTVKKQRQSTESRKSGEAPTWRILDEPKLNQALAMLREASKQKHFINRQQEFISARIPLLPQHDWISRLVSMSYVSGYLASDFTMRYLIEAVAAKAWLLGETGGAAEFRPLLEDANAFIVACGGMQHPTLVDVLLLKSNAALAVWNLHAAAVKLGLVEETERLQRLKGKLEQWSEDKKQRGQGEQMALQSSFLTRSIDAVRSQVKSPPPLTDADLKPGRMVEHLLASRVALLAVWTLLGIAIAVLAVYRFCLPRWLRSLAQRMNALLLPVDWAWMLGAGVVLPFGYVTVLMRCTPLGGQDLGLIKGGVAPVLAADFLALALLMLVMPAMIAHWRLGRRAAAFGICTARALWGWLAVAAGAAAVPLIGLTPMPVADLNLQLVLKLAMLAPLLLVIFANVVRALVLPFTRQFSRAVVALTLIPAYACGMLWVMLSLPVYQAAQAAWERRDAMTEITVDGITRYEGEVARQLLREVRQVLELEPIHGVR